VAAGLGDAVAIVGAGLTAASAAATLREEGFPGDIAIIGAEPELPYERPPLSKEYLRGEATAAELLFNPADWYASNDITVHLGVRATRLLHGESGIELDDGRTLRAGRVLLATGGRPRLLPGAAGERIVYLRTRADADRLRSLLRPDGRLVIVGAGFIGSEVAASARQLGLAVTLLEALPVPLGRALGEDMGAVCGAIHRDNGVDLRTGEGVASVTETPDGVRVRTSSGAVVDGDAVLVGVGIEPNVELAAGAGLETTNGIAVDEHCRTSVDGIYAAGDVADHYHPLFGRRLRVEHFDNAEKQGACAARNMLGLDEPYTDPHWFWSDQYEHNLQYAGHAATWDEVVIRGSIEERDFTAFYLDDGDLSAAFAIDRGGDVYVAKLLIAARVRPDPARLADEDVDLEELLEAH
jgi:3-phenylpropionate/trans-cinnamate dioxygenase ferredoxin reductase component